MSKGISIYSGLGYSLEENLEYIKEAYKNGFDRVFTSFHIPEADYNKFAVEMKAIIVTAKKMNMKITADISPKGFEFLNLSMKDLKAVKNSGIDILRIDFGFTAKEIAEFTNNSMDLKIEINASTTTERFLEEFEKHKPNYRNFQACHNYYPRANTGLSIESFRKKNKILKEYDVEISAFIPSQVKKRGPVFEGLPTLEIHRRMNSESSAKHLYILGVDTVFFGDSIPSSKEIEEMGAVKEEVLQLKVRLYDKSEFTKTVLNKSYTNRSDAAEDVIRAVEGRSNIQSIVIEPFHTIERKRGAITLDNVGYLRYMGELQICKKNLPKDSRVNVIASLVEEELFLLEHMEEESKFSFKLIE